MTTPDHQAIEQHKITVLRYRTPAGEPTCAIDFEKGHVCTFYYTRSFGTRELCFMPIDRMLTRQGAGDYLKPHKQCPIWEQS